MKIEIKIKPSTLQKVNIIVSQFEFDRTKQGKIEHSIAQNTALKLARKQFTLLGKDKSKKYKITLEYFEAELLERKIRFKSNLNYESLLINQQEFYSLIAFCNDLHQKLA